MVFEETSTQDFYAILDLNPDASQQEIREAYLRTKSAYNKDSLALYTLVDPGERESELRRVEEAYEVLSNPDKRKHYDQRHSQLSAADDFLGSGGLGPFAGSPGSAKGKGASRKVVSIDRVPPMESSSDPDGMLVAPTTDFPALHESERPAARSAPPSLEVLGSGGAGPSASGPRAVPGPAAARPARAEPEATSPAPLAQSLGQEISEESEWKGAFFRRVREARRLSVEEVSATTKISKSYVLAIEDEEFAKLPAAVYLRGFVVQIARVLKLPHDRAAAAYMSRYYQARPDQVK